MGALEVLCAKQQMIYFQLQLLQKACGFINFGLANKVSTIPVKRENTDMPDMAMYL